MVPLLPGMKMEKSVTKDFIPMIQKVESGPIGMKMVNNKQVRIMIRNDFNQKSIKSTK